MPEDTPLSRFNADFNVPESDDAARIAHEVKASIDSWVDDSISVLEQQTKQRSAALCDAFDAQVTKTTAALNDFRGKIDAFQRELANFQTNDGALIAKVQQLNKAVQDGRDAMAAEAKKWERYAEEATKAAADIGTKLIG